MEIRDLKYLTASASAGNFGRVAKSLGLNTSTISRRIGRLEDELGLALFERGHSGVRLTAGGRAVLLHVRRALAEVDAVERSGIQNGTGGVGEIRRPRSENLSAASWPAGTKSIRTWCSLFRR